MLKFKNIKQLLRTLSICLVFSLSYAYTATLQAKSYDSSTKQQTLSKKQLECIATSTYHEARGESEKGMLATIFVVLNRTKHKGFPSTPCKVISQPNQFSWYGKGKVIKEPEMYEKAKQLVQEVIDGKHKDFTYGALYFVHVKINRNWLEKLTYTCTIGNHKFFK